MARFFLFLVLLVPLTVAGDWLFRHPGMVRIDWLNYDIEIHTAVAVALLGLMYLFALLIAIALWQLFTWPARRRARRRHRTLSKGLMHLTHGVTALALGDETRAETSLKKAQATLPGEPLPKLLTAQLLQRQGKHEAARTHFRGLLAHPATAQLATHRLIEQHLARKEWELAAEQAEDARRDAPKDRWLALTLIDLYARMKQPSRLLQLTEGWHWQSPLTREERHRYAAIGYLLQAQTEDATPRSRAQALRHATGYAPDFLPAVQGHAAQMIEAGELRSARKLLQNAWTAHPVPLLIPLILQSTADASPRQQQRFLRAFRQPGPNYFLLLGQQALNAGEYERAREEAQAALRLEESKQGCAIMAEAEKKLNGAEAATVWLARAMDAPAAPGWICQRCGTHHAAWKLHCSGCDTFDMLMYERPEKRITSVEVVAPPKE